MGSWLVRPAERMKSQAMTCIFRRSRTLATPSTPELFTEPLDDALRQTSACQHANNFCLRARKQVEDFHQIKKGRPKTQKGGPWAT